ncbi:hypothetical protein GCM10028791_02260 [Echinicola sediminis]
MSKTLRKLYLTFLLFCVIFTLKAQSNSDSLSTIEFLKKADKVQSMTFGVAIDDLSTSSKEEGNQSKQSQSFGAKTYVDFMSALNLRDSLLQSGEKRARLQFFIFDKEKNFKSVVEYISIVKENELYIPKSEESQSDEDIIIAANRVDFKPYYKLRYRILTDIKFIILIGILGLMLITFTFLLFFLLVIRSKNRKYRKTVKEFKAICQDPLSSLLFEFSLEEISNMSYAELKSKFSNDYFEIDLFKDTLIKEIVNVNKSLKGEFKDKLREIYIILKLDQFSIHKLESRKWDVQSSGIIELYEMNIDTANNKIQKLTSSKNFIVRTNAVRAMLHLSKDKDLKFLADQEYPLSRWQQMAYYRVLKNLRQIQKVKVSNLLESQNESVRIFGIKLVRFLGRVELLEKLSEMYPTASLEEKNETLITFRALTAFGETKIAYEALMQEDTKLAISAATLLGEIGDQESVEKLVEKLNSTDEFILQKTILTSLYQLDEVRFEQEVEKQNEEHIYLIRNHIKDSLLTYV